LIAALVVYCLKCYCSVELVMCMEWVRLEYVWRHASRSWRRFFMRWSRGWKRRKRE